MHPEIDPQFRTRSSATSSAFLPTPSLRPGASRFRLRPLVVLATVALAVGSAAQAVAVTYVQLDYSLELDSRGRNMAIIELFDDRPLTTANFLQYVNGGHYDGSIMHRLAKNFVIQGGGFYADWQLEPFPVSVSLDPNAVIDLDGNPATPNPTVNNEFANTPMRSNVRGTLAMAKVGGNPNSATNQWFVNLKDNGDPAPNGLDHQNGGFTVFARVLGDGMALFDAMNAAQITNLNPDSNNNGVRDTGPFGRDSGDGIPVYYSLNADDQLVTNVIELESARRIDYYGAGPATPVTSAGIAFTTRDAFIDTDAGFFSSGGGPVGGFRIGAGRTLGIREGFTTGRVITNEGTLAPGGQVGIVTIWQLDQKNTGRLEIQLGGTTVDSTYDRLVVSNQAKLGGTLDVSLLRGFTPEAGNSFTVLTAGSITGNFSDLVLPDLSPGLVWDVNVGATAVTLTVDAADFNRDGVVDAADYTLWRDTRGTNVAAFTGADGNGDGTINNADFNVWKSNFGKMSSPQSFATGGGSLAVGAVPEPSSLLLALLALALVRRRSPRSA